MSEPDDLVGRKIGRMEVLAFAGSSRSRPPRPTWRCRCECGTVKVIADWRLRTSGTSRARGCGCNIRTPGVADMKALDLKGERFGMLVVRCKAPPRPGGQGSRWVCDCDCGREVECRAKDLRTAGNTTSCGCRINRLQVSRGEVTPRQRVILDAISQNGGSLLMSDLYERLNVSQPSVTNNTAVLDCRGYLAKASAGLPGRGGRKLLRLLPKGEAFLLETGAAQGGQTVQALGQT